MKVPAGANITVVAHLDRGRQPVLTPFVNDTSAIDAGKARITVRHTAAAPAVDVRANGGPAFKGLTNPNEAKADLPAGTYPPTSSSPAPTPSRSARPTSTSRRAPTPSSTPGAARGRQPELAVQTVERHALGTPGVPGGTGGQAANSIDAQPWALALGGVAAGAMALLLTRRPARQRVQ